MMAYELTDMDRAIAERSIKGIEFPVPERLFQIHRKAILQAEERLSVASMYERTIALRTYALELLEGITEEEE